MATRMDGAPRTERDSLEGVVRIWDVDRAYGWIESSPGRRFFVNIADVVGRVELRLDQFVRFMPIRTARGPRALAVEIICEEGS